MKKDVGLENEVERTIKKYYSINKLPSAFSKSSSKSRLDMGDKIMILLGILLFLFVCSRIVIVKIDKFVPDKLNNLYNLQYLKDGGTVNEIYKDRCLSVDDIEKSKNIFIKNQEG